MPELHIHDGSVWREANEVHIHDGSVWRDCQEVYVHDGTTWRLAFERANVALSGQLVVDVTASTAAKAGIRVNTDGTIDQRTGDSYAQIDAGTDWVIPNYKASSEYEVRITGVSWTAELSGFDIAAAAENTWVDMSANREWTVIDPADDGQNKWVTFTLEIRKNGGATITTGSYTLRASYGVV